MYIVTLNGCSTTITYCHTTLRTVAHLVYIPLQTMKSHNRAEKYQLKNEALWEAVLLRGVLPVV